MVRHLHGAPRANKDRETPAGEWQSSAATASYVADMSAELATLANAAGLPMLAYFLNLARVEAQIAARDLGDRTSTREQPLA